MANVTDIDVLDAASATKTVSTIDKTIGPAGTAATAVQTIQGIAGMTKVLVTPDANSAVNLAQIAGGSAVVGHGVAAAALRVELPTDGTGVVGVNNAAGAAAVNVQDGGNSLTVDGTVSITANSAINLAQVAGVSTVVGHGVAAAALRVELPTDGTGVIATVGAVTAITNALPAGTNGIGKLTSNSGVTIGAVELAAAQTLATVTTVSTVTAVTTLTGSGVASGASDSGNPHKIGSIAIATLSGTTLVSAAQRVNAQGDLDGALITRNNYALGDVVNGNATSTNTSIHAVISAPGANVFLYITDVIIANTGSSTSLITLQYDTGGSPTTLAYTIAPAGGGSNLHFDPPLKVPTANKDFGFIAATASTTIYCSAIGFKSKI